MGEGRPFRLQDLSVIVTGAGGGIGSEIARALAARGARVMLADQRIAEAEAVAAELRAGGDEHAASAWVDIADPRAAKELVETTISRFGRVDALVNNAAIDAPPMMAWEVDEAHWRRLIDVNLTGAWWCTSAVIAPMVNQGFGKIVFISSLSGRVGSDRYSPAYSAAKGGLLGLTATLGRQLEPKGIRVNAICPGANGQTGTPMTSDERRSLLATFPLGLPGPRPVADAVCYLLDTSGDWISGAVLNVSGGQLRGF